MKKIIAALLCLCLALSGAGCGAAPKSSTPSITDNHSQVIVTSPTQPYHPPQLAYPMHAIVMPTISTDTLADDGTLIFTQSYQRIQLILNGTDKAEMIATDLQSRINKALDGSGEIKNFAFSDYTDPDIWDPYFIHVSYTPTRIDQAVLSLFCNLSSYSGGNHPALVTESVTYDLSTGSTLKLSDILVDNFSSADLCAMVVTALSSMTEELYYDYEACLEDIFCVNLSNIHNWYFSHSGLNFHFSPYEIAPYSSGTIIATIPYAQLKDILKEAYFPTVQPESTGSMYAEPFVLDDTERFAFLAQVELDADGTKVLLHPDAPVTDVRIECGEWSSDGSRYIPVSTVFTADAVGLGNGILLTAELSGNNPSLRLVYNSGGQEVSAFIVYDEAGDTILLSHG